MAAALVTVDRRKSLLSCKHCWGDDDDCKASALPALKINRIETTTTGSRGSRALIGILLLPKLDAVPSTAEIWHCRKKW